MHWQREKQYEGGGWRLCNGFIIGISYKQIHVERNNVDNIRCQFELCCALVRPIKVVIKQESAAQEDTKCCCVSWKLNVCESMFEISFSTDFSGIFIIMFPCLIGEYKHSVSSENEIPQVYKLVYFK